MSYLDLFKETSVLKGSTRGERIANDLQGGWDRYFNETPNRITVDIDGTSEDVVIQHQRYGEDKYDNQLLLTQNSTVVEYGSKLTWDGKVWIVINKENRAIETHKAWKILLTQNFMTSRDKFGVVTNEPCHISSTTTRNDGNVDVGFVNGSWIVRVQRNVASEKYFINQRFIFDNKVAKKVVDLNYSEFTGQVVITLEPTQILPQDDLLNNIAYNGGDIDTIPQEGKTGVFFTEDSLNIKVGFEETVEVYEYLNDAIVPSETFTFRIDNIDTENYTIQNQASNSITIRCIGYYYSGTLVAIKDSDLSEYSIPLILSSPLG